MESPSVRVAIIGAGTVGAALVAMLNDHTRDAALHEAVGGTVEIVGIAVRDLQRPRPGIAQELLTTDADALVARDDVDIVVELAGGVDDAYRYVRRALESGKSVVTANKALLAEHGASLHRLAEDLASVIGHAAERLGRADAPHLVGHSFGGLVAQLLARGPQTLLPSLEAAYPWLLALALTRGAPNTIVAPGEEANAVAPLPVAALGVDDAIVRGLRRAGLKTIGEVLQLTFEEAAAIDAVIGRGHADPLLDVSCVGRCAVDASHGASRSIADGDGEMSPIIERALIELVLRNVNAGHLTITFGEKAILEARYDALKERKE